MSTEAARGRALSHQGPRVTGRAAALLVAVTLLAIVALVPARQFLDQRSEIAELERQTEQLARRNAALEEEIARLYDPVELERLARECLGMVAPGETALILPDGNPDHADC